ncbi:src kinase-associated phosphoprotein 2 [Trematomus bernacchii]|uniref:src kinase-associated phosphoprotein 2 n=1 Tax=Trematomus bernacchii TaxID=40690 RepID=UPI001469B3FF|nr:src kinase-associated phosphoprotein 2 [Trematomus bernacchii]
MRAIPEELTTLISDLEYFISDGLKGENLSKKAKEKRDAFIRRIQELKLGFPHDFKDRSGDEEDDEEEVDSNNDGGSQQSERTDKDEDAGEGAQQSPPVAAQDLTSVFKAGYLEKRRKDHSFFGTEWQKRWCALSQHTFYYYGSEKDKQQKGEFSIDGYTVKMNSTLRKDSKKDCCFEITAPDKRVYQFCASSVREAEEWVKQIDFVLKDMPGIIQEDEEEEQDVYDDVDIPASEPIDEDIYEELPEDDLPTPAKPPPKVVPASKPSPPAAVDKSTDYPNFYQGLWDCSGDQPDELTFKRGDAIYILSKEYQSCGWWVGEKNGSIGIVPKDYLMELYAI